MKIRAFILTGIAAIVLFSGIVGVYSAIPTTSDLVIYHKFDGDLSDEEGGNDFVALEEMFGGTAVFSDIGTNNLGAISATDNNVIFEKDVTGTFPSGDWDITFTILPNSVPVANGVIAMFGDDFFGDGEAYVSFELKNGDGTLDVYAYNPANLADSLHLSIGNVIIDELNLVRLSFDSDTELLSGYLNNMADAGDRGTFTEDADFSAIVQTLFILGGQSLGGPVAFDGPVANFGVFDVNQTNEYFDSVYNAGDVQELNHVVTFPGSGTELDPYLISSCAELVSMSDTDAFYVLTDDIDCSEQGVISPLFGDGTFSGDFNGDGYEITGLDIVDNDSITGLFSAFDGATIYDLGIAGEVTGDGNETGSLVGRVTNASTITNVSSDFIVNGDQNYVGGLVGSTEGEEGVMSEIVDSIFTGTIYAGPDDEASVQGVGGIAGSGSYLIIDNSQATADIYISDNATYDVGGIIGYASDSDIDGVVADGSISVEYAHGINRIGGVVGSMTLTSLVDSSSTADLLIGTEEEPVYEVFAIGGVVGSVEESSTFSDLSSEQVIAVYVDSEDTLQFIGGIAGNYCMAFEVDIDLCSNEILNVNSRSSITVEGGDGSGIGGLFGALFWSPITTSVYEGVMDVDLLNAQFVGGQVGYALDLDIDDAIVDAEISVDVIDSANYLGSVGGLIGYAELDSHDMTISNSYTLGTMYIGQTTENDLVEFVGGLVGNTAYSTSLYAVYSKMDMLLSSSDYLQGVGGLIGYADGDNDVNSLDTAYYFGDIDLVSIVTNQFVGGLYGYLSVGPGGTYTVTDVFSVGSITNAGTEVGGLFGYVEVDGAFVADNGYSIIDLDGQELGGLFGVIDVVDPETVSVANMFFGGSLLVSADTIAEIAISSDASIFSNIYYDAEGPALVPCIVYDLDYGSCSNIDGFMRTDDVEPITSWTFDETHWGLSDVYPYLVPLGNVYVDEIDGIDIEGYELGDFINESQPTFNFSATSDDDNLVINYIIEIAFDSDFEDSAIIYESGPQEHGDVEFTVGQDEGDGAYAFGEEDQELEDGLYFVRAVTIGDGIQSIPYNNTNEYEVEFTVDTTDPVLTEYEAVAAEVDSDTAIYSFTVEEANEVEYELSLCNDNDYDYVINDEGEVATVTFTGLTQGEEYECNLVAIDVAGNESNELTIGPFVYPEEITTGGSSGGGSAYGGGRAPLYGVYLTYEEEVDRVLREGVVTEDPANGTNKCEALVMMSRVFSWTVDENAVDSYTDTPTWCKPYAAFATARGIVHGRTEGVLGLDTDVSRFEVAVMLDKELSIQGYLFNGNVLFSFQDSIVDWASDSVNRLAKEGILKGFGNGIFGGDLGILKQDLGVVLLRVRDKISI